MRVIVGNEVKEVRSVWYEPGQVCFIDQRKLPGSYTYFYAKSVDEVAYAIKDMVVRGAPAIGIAAAYGMALAWEKGDDLVKTYEILKNTRPTAHDLFYALNYMIDEYKKGKDLVDSAEKYADEIIAKCRAIGVHGEKLIEDGYRILTHCNAGALATADWGTALAPIRMAHRNGKKVTVWVDETRPRLQGASLTAWELLNEGIEHYVIADNAAGYFMWRGEVDMVIVGADRITRNGDVANKIGTFEKAVLAKELGIPFYVAAPMSTFDFSIADGKEIPIEERSEDEVHYIKNIRITPINSWARNPAFDVTPAKYITGIITEKGIFKPEEIEKVMKEE